MDLRNDSPAHEDQRAKAARVRRTIPDIKSVPNSHIIECYQICREIWLSVICDSKDTWKYFPDSMITEAQQVWEERIELFEYEMKLRNLNPESKLNSRGNHGCF